MKADIEATLTGEFIQNDSDYIATQSIYAKRLAALTAQLVTLQEQGKRMPCSDQILIEARWLVEHTSDWVRTESQLEKLVNSFSDSDQNFADDQAPEDGAWGRCYTEWFMKLDATVDKLNELADQNETPEYPLSFLERIRSSEALFTYLKDLLVSDIARTGKDNRDELGAVTAALSQIFFKAPLRILVNANLSGWTIDEQYISAYRIFLDSWQNHDTGYWGAWYRSQGKVFGSSDLSLTFHVISYRDGQVPLWSNIVNTTLSIKNLEYPYGWMHNGRYTHHNNYDVVKILRYGWPHMNQDQRERSRAALDDMLTWCLSKPMREDTLFAIDPTFYSNPANYFYYGVSFLDEIGYWDASRRFWTDRGFPEAHSLCTLIKSKLVSLNFNAPAARAALRKLEASCR